MTPPPQKNNSLLYAAGDVIIWAATQNSAAPTAFESPDTIVGATYRCLGWVDTSGFIFKLDETTKDIGAAGTLSSIRTIITGGLKTVQATFLEALNPYVRSLFDDIPIFPVASSPLKPASGTVANWIIPDPPLDNRYSMIFDSVDSTRKHRLFSPNAKVTARGDDTTQQADVENLQMTFTLYPGTIGANSAAVAQRYVDYSYASITNYFT